jgi:hypothetical protein
VVLGSATSVRVFAEAGGVVEVVEVVSVPPVGEVGGGVVVVVGGGVVAPETTWHAALMQSLLV